MAIQLPGGPDKLPVARRRVPVSPKKPKKRKTTPGNVYRSTPPKVRTPAAPVPAPTTRLPVTPGRPVPGPFDRFKDIPGALAGIASITDEQNRHQNYVNQTVAPWLTSGLQGLAQMNTAAQNDYINNIQGGQVGGAIAPLGAQSAAPGGMVAGNNAYLTGAGQQYSMGQGSVAQQIAAYQGAMNKMQPTTLSQGYINSLPDYAKGLPAQYSERRRAFIDKLDGYLAEAQQAQAEAQMEAAKQAEVMRHNRVTEAISATNASTNAAYQASALGLKAGDQAFDQQSQLTAAATPSPNPSYTRDPATGDLVRDYTVPTASSSGSSASAGRRPTSTRDAKGRYLQPAEHGFTVGGWTKKPKGLRVPVTQGADGKWYAKPGKGSGGRTPTVSQVKAAKGKSADDVYNKVTGSVVNGAVADDQPTATGDLLRILRPMQPTNKANFAAWWAEVAPVLRRIDPRYEEWMTGYIKRRKAGVGGVSWKGLF